MSMLMCDGVAQTTRTLHSAMVVRRSHSKPQRRGTLAHASAPSAARRRPLLGRRPQTGCSYRMKCYGWQLRDPSPTPVEGWVCTPFRKLCTTSHSAVNAYHSSTGLHLHFQHIKRMRGESARDRPERSDRAASETFCRVDGCHPSSPARLLIELSVSGGRSPSTSRLPSLSDSFCHQSRVRTALYTCAVHSACGSGGRIEVRVDNGVS